LSSPILSFIKIHTANPQAGDWLEVGIGAQLRQRVEREGVVAKNTSFVDGWQQEDLLYAGSVGVIVWRLESRGDDGRRFIRRVIGLGGEKDKVEDFGRCGAYVEVAVCDSLAHRSCCNGKIRLSSNCECFLRTPYFYTCYAHI
jgi:hypothetical protein